MKPIFLILFLALTFNSFAQTKKYYDRHDVYLGMYISDKLGTRGFIQYENDGELALVRIDYLTDFNHDHRINVKLSIQVFKWNDIRFLTGLPPFHYSDINKGYNTPVNFEIQFKRKVLFNIDLYRDNFNLSVQLRQKF
jgi:hypothetical protein